MHQIYEAAESGHLDQAQQMMNQVLRDHPGSAKAHYVQAELYAREGKLALARSELNRAEEIAPGLPNENPQSVRALKSELGMGVRAAGERPFGIEPGRRSNALPVGDGADSRAGRRRVLDAVPSPQLLLCNTRPPAPRVRLPAVMARATARGGYVGPGPMGGGGIGSSVAGGLAGGLAAGAGIVAGEELAHHFLDGGQLARRRGAAGERR